MFGQGTLGKGGKKERKANGELLGGVVVVNKEFLHNQSFVETHVNGDWPFNRGGRGFLP